MKIAFAGALVLLMAPTGAPVGFEADGVRVAGALVVDPVLQLKDSGAGHVLVSASVVEPLSGALTIALSADCSLALEPGIRVARTKEGFSLTAHNRRRLDVGGLILMTPVVVEVVGKGLRVAGGKLVEGTLAVRRVQQDDTDENLKKLQEEAKRLQKSLEDSKKQQEKPAPAAPETGKKKQQPIPPIFANVFLKGEGMSKNALLPLFEASPIGF